MRVNKFLASCGVASRRKCDEMIEAGRVSVNGETIGIMGRDVGPADVVMLDGVEVHPTAEKEYYLLNKPAGYVCSCSDERGRATVLSLIKSDARLFPVGRLDYDTEGLLIITNDGDLSNKVAHPSNHVKKEYYAEVEGIVQPEHIKLLRSGVSLDDGRAAAKAEVRLVASGKISRLYITIGEGRNRQVRRMFEAMGLTVLYLSRTKLGEIVLDGSLKPGEYRPLTDEELNYLRQF